MSIPLHIDGPAKVSPVDFHCGNHCWWCDGCGDYGVWTATKRALAELAISPTQVVMCYDVGCNGNGSDKMLGYRFHGLHGRVIPFAAGAKLANPRLPVIASGGDGASFSEGVGHFVHAIRSNYPITFILHNNANYGLTTGQASSLTWQGQPMNSSPNGMPEQTINSMDFIFSLEPTFVARGFSGNILQLTQILKAAIRHQQYGFAVVDVLQACPTYNHFATHEYLLQHCYDANAEGHSPTCDLAKARSLAIDTSKRIATGILYERRDVPSFYDRLEPRKGKTTVATEEVAITDVSSLWKEFQ